MRTPETNNHFDALTLGLAALGWTVADPNRASRLLAVTGLTPDGLRGAAGEPATLAAVLAFLEAHETDLIACADAIGSTAAALVRAHSVLESA